MKTISNQTLTIRAFITTILIVIVSLLICMSCSVADNYKSKFETTRIYVGKYTGVNHKIDDNTRLILTSDIIIRCKCDQSIESIPPGTLCYIDLKPCKYDYITDLAYQLDSQYLVFVSGENEDQVKYRVVKNHKFY